MVNLKYIEFLNTIGADSDVKPQPLEPAEPPKQLDTTQLKTHIAKGLPPIATAGIGDLPFKIKIDESEWRKIEGVGKFPKSYKPDALDFD
jgi:hypothetical protein